jgi:hypothetical protein
MRFLGPSSVYDLSDIGVGVFEGCDAIRGFLEDWLGSYDEAADEPKEPHRARKWRGPRRHP